MTPDPHGDPGPGGRELALRARVLRETLPALERLRGSVVVIKYGGSVLEDEALARSWASDVVLLARLGLFPVVVHGGGPALTRTLERLGVASSFRDGQRVTTPEAAEVAEMVLSGRINKQVVGRLAAAGARAVGLCGSDGGLLRVRPHRPGGGDLGRVAEVEETDPAPLRLLLDAGYLPVVSSTASDRLGEPWNLNADRVAAAVPGALGARRLVFLSDVPGVLVEGERAPLLGEAQARALLASGVAAGGMRPKLEAALAALAAGVERVHLVDGRVRSVLLVELLLEEGRGTLLVPDREAPLQPAIPRSGAAAGEALPIVPWAGTLAARGGAALVPSYARHDLELVSGRGCRVVASDGRSYLDFASGIAVSALGHAHPAVVAAIRAGAAGLLHASNLYWTEPMVRLAERLAAASGLDRAFFCNSGTEAIEAALKAVRRARPGRPHVVVFERSFHGRTLGALSATAQPAYQEPFRPLLPGFLPLPFGDFDAAASAIDATVAAVLVEPVQGEGGVRPAPDGWLAHLRKRCDAAGALLVLDEVQTGLGRTGRLFACHEEGVLPDAIACAKALAGGLPMGALLARGDAASALGPGDHGSTFGGGPFVAGVACAVLDVLLAPGFLAGVRARGERLAAGLRALAAGRPELVVEARGRGLLQGLALGRPVAPDLVKALQARGLLALTAGKDVLRLLPPLVVSDAEVDEGLAAIAAALDGLDAAEASAPACAPEGAGVR